MALPDLCMMDYFMANAREYCNVTTVEMYRKGMFIITVPTRIVDLYHARA